VSLILEALKKLEREKPSADRGFLVMAHVPWAQGAGGRSRVGWLVGLGLVAGAVLLSAAWWTRGRNAPVSTSAPAAPISAPAAASPSVRPLPPALAFPPEPRPGAAGSLAPARPPLELTPRLAESPETPLAESPEAVPPAAPPDASSIEAPAIAPTETTAIESAPAPSTRLGSDLRLNAISQQDGRPVAVVNERLVREGDIFDGIRIVRIGETEVEVEVEGKRRILRF
jgi:hypothetical protein